MTQPAPQRLTAPAASSSSGRANLPAPAGDNPTPLTRNYHPAEYRWVPVRRRPRYDGWTEEKQRRFIEVLAGAVIEDIAFERAIEGVEVEIYTSTGELKESRIVYNDRLLAFLLRHLKPEVYSAAARERRGGAWKDGKGEHSLDEALRAMEPQPPAPPETLADDGDLENDLMVAEIADGVLPPHLSEQRAPKSPEQLRAEAAADLLARGEAADAKLMRGEELTVEEYDAWCAYLDPAEGARMLRTRRKPRKPRKA